MQKKEILSFAENIPWFKIMQNISCIFPYLASYILFNPGILERDPLVLNSNKDNISVDIRVWLLLVSQSNQMTDSHLWWTGVLYRWKVKYQLPQ